MRGNAKRTSVVTQLDSCYYTSVEGLKDGDKVVISGFMKIKKGRALEPVDVTETKGITAVLKAKNLIHDEVQK